MRRVVRGAAAATALVVGLAPTAMQEPAEILPGHIAPIDCELGTFKGHLIEQSDPALKREVATSDQRTQLQVCRLGTKIGAAILEGYGADGQYDWSAYTGIVRGERILSATRTTSFGKTVISAAFAAPKDSYPLGTLLYTSIAHLPKDANSATDTYQVVTLTRNLDASNELWEVQQTISDDDVIGSGLFYSSRLIMPQTSQEVALNIARTDSILNSVASTPLPGH